MEKTTGVNFKGREENMGWLGSCLALKRGDEWWGNTSREEKGKVGELDLRELEDTNCAPKIRSVIQQQAKMSVVVLRLCSNASHSFFTLFLPFLCAAPSRKL
jgi:hypothetical protein